MFGASTDSLEDFFLVFGLISVQTIYGIYGVLMAYLLSIGLKPLFLVIYGSLATSILLTPIAFFAEKNLWPGKFSVILLIQFLLIGLGGVTVFQGLMLVGIKKTSPAFASAMPNLAPGFIFIIAGCLGFEKIKWTCMYTRTKIVGTLICIGGALVMSFLQGPPVSHMMLKGTQPLGVGSGGTYSMDKLEGCMSLLTAVFVLSCTIVLQATALAEFPAPLSLTAITSFIGFIVTGILQFIEDGTLDSGSNALSFQQLVTFALMGGVFNGFCVAIQAWSVKKRGPVFVSMFNPIATVVAAILSSFTMGESLRIGSIAGMSLMFSGLYFVLWAKRKEDSADLEDDEILESKKKENVEPLLS